MCPCGATRELSKALETLVQNLHFYIWGPGKSYVGSFMGVALHAVEVLKRRKVVYSW